MNVPGPHHVATIPIVIAGLLLLPSVCVPGSEAVLDSAATSVSAVPDSLTRANGLDVVLDNGLRLSVREQPGAPLVEVLISFAVGSGLDPEGREGTAHLLEHLMMRSSTRRPHGGVERGLFLHSVQSNAFTSIDRIRVTLRCLPAQLDSLLNVGASILAGIDVDSDELARERAVVFEEVAFRRLHSPLEELFSELIRRELSGHPMGRATAGTRESLTAITREDLLRFQHEWLQPDLAAVAIVGPVAANAVREAVEATLGQVKGEAAPLELPPLPPPRGVSAVLHRADARGFAIARVIRVPFRDATDLAMVELLHLLFDHAGLRAIRRQIGDSMWFHTWSVRRYFLRPELGFDRVQPQRDASRLMEYTWQALQREVRHVRWSDRFPELQQEWIDQIRARRERQAGTAIELTENAHAPASNLDWERAIARAGEMTREEAVAWLKVALSRERVSVGAVHGFDSGGDMSVEVAGAGRAEAVRDLADPLDRLDLDALRDAISRYRGSPGPRILTRTVGGSPWAHLRLASAKDLHLGVVLAIEPLEEEKPSNLPGVARIYGDLAQGGYRRSTSDRDDERERRLPHGMTVDATPTRLRIRAADPVTEAEEMIEAVAQRLESDSFDLRMWRWMLESGPRIYTSGPSALDDRITRFLMRRALGPDEVGVHRWLARKSTFEDLEYHHMEEVQKSYVEKGARRLWTVGPAVIENLESLLNRNLARRGGPDWPRAAVGTSPTAEGPRGRVFLNVSLEEIQLRVVAGLVPDEGLTWARLALLESLVESRCRSRLRAEKGLVYDVQAEARPVNGRWVLEVRTGSNPEYAHTTFRELLGVLAEISEGSFESGELERARLRALRVWTDRLTDAGRAAVELERMIEFGSPPEWPLRALLEIDDEAWKSLVAQAVQAKPLGFAVAGPVFEDEREVYLRTVEEVAGEF